MKLNAILQCVRPPAETARLIHDRLGHPRLLAEAFKGCGLIELGAAMDHAKAEAHRADPTRTKDRQFNHQAAMWMCAYYTIHARMDSMGR